MEARLQEQDGNVVEHPLREVHTQQPFRERRKLVGAETQTFDLLSERMRLAEMSADVDVESFELVHSAVPVDLLGDEHAHEADVRELVARARVRASVDV